MVFYYCGNCPAVSEFGPGAIIWRCHACLRMNCSACRKLHDAACEMFRAHKQVAFPPAEADQSSSSSNSLANTSGNYSRNVSAAAVSRSYSTVAAPSRRQTVASRPAPMRAKSVGQLPHPRTFCDLCQESYAVSYWSKHITTKKHKENKAKQGGR